MNLPEILPPSDLLTQVEGIERGLRQRQRLSSISWLASLVFSALQIVFLVSKSKWPEVLASAKWGHLLLYAPIFLVALSVFLFLAVRYWLKESQASFRYTYSIADFSPIAKSPVNSKLIWLRHDLLERLSLRIGRLSYLEQKIGETNTVDKHKSHIHIGGYYVIRQEPREGEWVIEVTPWVRIGPSDSPEALAHPVKFLLAFSRGEGSAASPPELSRNDYEKLLERVYFSVATQIYTQIRQDVDRKIDLLPTNFLRATAYLYEAEDYAGSNTLYAYDEALKLYSAAMRNYDPSLWAPLSHLRFRRWLQRFWYHGMVGWFWRRLRRQLMNIWPRLGRVEVMAAKAESGYANMLLFRRPLALLSGQRLNPIFEARPVTWRAVKRLESLPTDVPGQRESLFNAYVSSAFAWAHLSAGERAQKSLNKARQLIPAGVDLSAHFAFVDGVRAVQPRDQLEKFRKAVELDPAFEIAQFYLAGAAEKQWRVQQPFEHAVAAMVCREYERVLRVNPSNIAAWANQGYIYWLLGDQRDLDQARVLLMNGREYKEIQRQTFVAELDHGLARIAAEQGNFEEAYAYYTSAEAARLAQGVSHDPAGYTTSQLSLIGLTMWQRYDRYKDTVSKHYHLWKNSGNLVEHFCETVQKLSVSGANRRDRENLLCLLQWITPRLTVGEKKLLSDRIAGVDLDAWVAGFNDASTEKIAKLCEVLGETPVKDIISTVLRQATTERVRKVVFAYALNDFGEACFNYFLNSGNARYLRKAIDAYQQAVKLHPDYVIPHYNLYRAKRENREKGAIRRLQRVIKLAPDWPDGKLGLAEARLFQAQEAMRKAKEKSTQKQDETEKAKQGRLDAQLALTKADDRDKDAQIHRKRHEAKAKRDEAKAKRNEAKTKRDEEKAKRDGGTKTAGMFSFERPSLEAADTAALDTAANELDKAASELEEEFQRLESEVKTARREAEELIRQAEGLEQKSNQLRKHTRWLEARAVSSQRESIKLAQSLLPHRWLWHGSDKANYTAFVSDTGRRSYHRELKWEREFDDLHVRALFTWVRARALDVASDTDAAAADQLRKDNRRRLAHIRKHFWPNNFDVWRSLREVYGDKSDGYHDRPIRAIIKDWVAENPGTFWPLTWVTFAAEKEQRQILQNASRLYPLAESLCKWLGDEQYRLGDQLAALNCYRRAMTTKDPDLLFQLGRSLENLAISWDDSLLTSTREVLNMSLQAFRKAMDLDRTSGSAEAEQTAKPEHTKEEYHQCCGGVLLALKQYDTAIRELEFIKDLPHNGSSTWRQQALKAISHHIKTRNQYYRVRAWLEDEQTLCRQYSDTDGAADADAAILSLVRDKHLEIALPYDELRSVVPSYYKPSVATAVSIELGSKLHTKAIENGTHSLITEYIPSCREQVWRELGVEIPEVLVYSNRTWQERSYLLLLGEIPVVIGTPKEPSADAVESGWQPANVTRYLPGAENLNDAKGDSYDEYQYIARHLHGLLCAHLGRFIDARQVDIMLRRWLRAGLPAPHADYAKALSNDYSALASTARLLRRLVEEGVPLTTPVPLLSALQSLQKGSSFHDQLACLRLALRDVLPGNDPEGLVHLRLGDDVERMLAEHFADVNGEKALVLNAESLQEFLSAIRTEVGSLYSNSEPKCALVVGETNMRPYIQYLTADEWQKMPVLAREELIPALDLGYERFQAISLW